MAFGQGGSHPFQGFGDFPAGMCRFDASVDEENHPVGTVQPPGETLDVLAAESPQTSGFAQDVTSQRVAAKNQILEIVENQFGRRVVVAFYFVDDHFHFFVHLCLGIGAAQHDVGQQIHSTCEVFFQESRVVNGFLFARVGVQVPSYAFHAVQDMPGAAPMRPLESQVLAKVCQPVFVRQFVACTGIDGDAAIYHVRGRRGTDDAHAAGKGMGIGNCRSGRCCCHVVMLCVYRTKLLQTAGKEKETGRYLHKSLPLGRLRASSVCARLIAIFFLFRLLSVFTCLFLMFNRREPDVAIFLYDPVQFPNSNMARSCAAAV